MGLNGGTGVAVAVEEGAVLVVVAIVVALANWNADGEVGRCECEGGFRDWYGYGERRNVNRCCLHWLCYLLVRLLVLQHCTYHLAIPTCQP